MPEPIVHHTSVCLFCQRLEILLALKSCPVAALDLEVDAGHERVRSLYRRRGVEEWPRRRLVKRLVRLDGA